MKNELLPVVQNNKLKKIIDFLKRIFRIEKREEKYFIEENTENSIIVDEKNKFLEDIKISKEKLISFQNEQSNIALIKQLEKDDSILEKLSLDKLKELDKLYDELIEKKSYKLKKLTENN